MDVSAAVPPPYVAAPLQLHPFRAHLLEASRVGDPASARLFARPYRAVAERLRQWGDQGRITTDSGPAIYLHEYTASGMTIRGWVGALDLTRRAHGLRDRGVLPHEGVHPDQTAELAERMGEMRVNPAPILLVHQAAPGVARVTRRAMLGEPTWENVDRSGQRHRIWAVRDVADQAELNAALDHALLADGHHRYAAYLQLQARDPGGPADHGLAMLVDQAETPLFLGPIHRVLTDLMLDDLATAAAAAGLGTHEAAAPGFDQLAATTAVGTDGRRAVALTAGAGVTSEATMVELLHRDVLPRLPRPPRNVQFRHSVEEAVGAVGGSRAVAVLLPAPTFEQVLASVEAGRLLPEKATSFQPKPNVGVIMRSLDDEPVARR